MFPVGIPFHYAVNLNTEEGLQVAHECNQTLSEHPGNQVAQPEDQESGVI
jgi:hypothetical protein